VVAALGLEGGGFLPPPATGGGDFFLAAIAAAVEDGLDDAGGFDANVVDDDAAADIFLLSMELTFGCNNTLLFLDDWFGGGLVKSGGAFFTAPGSGIAAVDSVVMGEK